MENNFVALASGFTCDGVFRFGKHKGKSFVEVAQSDDADYFMWLWEESQPKETVTSDEAWIKHMGYTIVEVVEKHPHWTDYKVRKKPTFYLDKDLKEFITKNFDRLKKEAKRCKDAYEAKRYDEIMRDW